MAIPLVGAAVVSMLKKKGLQTVAEVALSKGQDYVEEKLGVKLSRNMSEEDLLELKKRAMEHEEFKLTQQNADRDSARKREVAIASDEKVPYINKVITPVLALFMTILTFIIFSVIIFVEIDTASKDILIYILGVLSACLTQILSYYFGSSSSEANREEKDKKFNGMFRS